VEQNGWLFRFVSKFQGEQHEQLKRAQVDDDSFDEQAELDLTGGENDLANIVVSDGEGEDAHGRVVGRLAAFKVPQLIYAFIRVITLLLYRKTLLTRRTRSKQLANGICSSTTSFLAPVKPRTCPCGTTRITTSRARLLLRSSPIWLIPSSKN
jgi:hypothetical protein